ncbi:ABC transporter substrate-binding protein [Psychromonas sp. MME2]|uniref:ABC transporter substrate-binding protein n=1 Tax=unclassified Psychromonas TaxID=2614957 RepID=UPI00339CEA99
MNNRKLFFFTLILIIFIIFINFNKGPLFLLLEPSKKNLSTEISGQAFPKTLHDPTGIEFVIDNPPQRILSATLATDHMLAGLIDPKRLVAVSSYVDYPNMSNVIGLYDSNIARTQGEIESMLALQPDLVFIASYSNPETVRYLLRSEIAVVRLGALNSFADIFNNINMIAQVTDSKERAQVIITNIKKRLHNIQKAIQGKPKLRVLYYNLDGYSTGAHSLMDETIRLAGGINVAAEILPDGENKISVEQAISLQPDVIIINQSELDQPSENASAIDILLNKKAWANVPAIKKKQVYAIPAKWLRSVSQHRIHGVEAVAKYLHPEIKTDNEALNE